MLYTVWVGGVEVCDDYIDNVNQAISLAGEYIDEGYTDVFVEARKWSEISQDAVEEIIRLKKVKEKKYANA